MSKNPSEYPHDNGEKVLARFSGHTSNKMQIPIHVQRLLDRADFQLDETSEYEAEEYEREPLERDQRDYEIQGKEW